MVNSKKISLLFVLLDQKNQKSRLIANFLFYTGCLLLRDKSRSTTIAYPSSLITA
jgi:hypothetical protein